MRSLSFTCSRWFAGLALALGMVCAVGQIIGAQQSAGPGGTSSATATAPVEVVGTVLDSRNRGPIQRALVHLGNRAVLTDHDGMFRFPEVTSASVSLQVNKPGFYPAADGDSGAARSYRLPVSAPIELVLYPEAILAGTATDSSGEGLAGLNVTAQRSSYDDNGHHWFPIGQTQTGSDGGFRLAVPSGYYTLKVDQRGRSGNRAEVVLPLSVPANTSSTAEWIHLIPGQEARLDLRPDVRPSYRVTVSVEPESRGYPMLTARGINGSTIPLSAMPSPGERGEFRVSLPRGTYTLFGSMQNQEGLFQAQTEVNVADHEVTGVLLRFVRAASLPVVVEVDSSATSDNSRVPDATQLGLMLQATTDGLEGGLPGASTVSRRNGSSVFSAADGVYHLSAAEGRQWYVASATCGGVDLLSRDLPVSAALDGTEVRIRLSNNTATLSGKVTVDGVPGSAWIYILATTPSASPVVTVRAGTGGTFSRPYLPPGSYRALALERKVAADFQSQETLNRYLNRLQTFTVAPGEQRTLNFVAVPERDLPQ